MKQLYWQVYNSATTHFIATGFAERIELAKDLFEDGIVNFRAYVRTSEGHWSMTAGIEIPVGYDVLYFRWNDASNQKGHKLAEGEEVSV